MTSARTGCLPAMSSSGLCGVWVGPANPWTTALGAAKFEPSAVIATISYRSLITAWRWSTAAGSP
jgi:hypothetical protein